MSSQSPKTAQCSVLVQITTHAPNTWENYLIWNLCILFTAHYHVTLTLKKNYALATYDDNGYIKNVVCIVFIVMLLYVYVHLHVLNPWDTIS